MQDLWIMSELYACCILYVPTLHNCYCDLLHGYVDIVILRYQLVSSYTVIRRCMFISCG